MCESLTAIGVTRDGGFAEYVAVPQAQAFVLPADLDPVHGAFSEPLACCIHAIDKAKIRPGDSVAILGGGVIGLLMVQLARLAGAGEIILITRQQSRRQTALRLGATHAFDPAGSDTIVSVREVTKGGADVVIECARRQRHASKRSEDGAARWYLRAFWGDAGGCRGAGFCPSICW